MYLQNTNIMISCGSTMLFVNDILTVTNANATDSIHCLPVLLA
jgi:hypothetical protein